MLDFIGSKTVVIRRTETGVSVTTTRNGQALDLASHEWLDLIALVTAVKAEADFRDNYNG